MIDQIPKQETNISINLPADFKLSVLMPVYNERKTVLQVLSSVCALNLPKEIIIIDDGSIDGTRDLLKTTVSDKFPAISVFYHQHNLGKGAAVRTALEYATGTICIIQDADLEYDPSEYYSLLRPILDGRADAVYGSRFLGRQFFDLPGFWHYARNVALTLFSNAFTNLKLTDVATGYKVIPTNLLQSLSLRANGFDIDSELTVKLARVKARILEVPISYNGRSYSQGKKITWKDGFQALWCICRSRVQNPAETI